MHLLYLIFGNNSGNYLQAYASITSFKAFSNDIKSINVITDVPEWFDSISHWLNIIPLTQEQLREWKGEYNYFWRAKIKAIQETCRIYPNQPVIYLDTDTFLYKESDRIADLLRQNKALMHINEGPVQQDRSKTIRKMYNQIRILKDAPVKNLHTCDMWNAGVAASPNTAGGDEYQLALDLCDYLCRNKVTDRLLEQFSLSVALKKTYGLEEVDTEIAHYWSNKDEWNQHWSQFFLSNTFKGGSIDDYIQNFRHLNLHEIPVMRISKNTKKRLINWVNKKFPDLKVEYAR